VSANQESRCNPRAMGYRMPRSGTGHRQHGSLAAQVRAIGRAAFNHSLGYAEIVRICQRGTGPKFLSKVPMREA